MIEHLRNDRFIEAIAEHSTSKVVVIGRFCSQEMRQKEKQEDVKPKTQLRSFRIPTKEGMEEQEAEMKNIQVAKKIASEMDAKALSESPKVHGSHPIRAVTFRFSDSNHWPFMLLWTTGPPTFFKKLQVSAEKKRFKLEHDGLRDENNDHVRVESEEELFRLLGFEAVEPSNRI